MTNTGLKAVIAEYPKALCYIMLDNAQFVLIGYKHISKGYLGSKFYNLPDEQRKKAEKEVEQNSVLEPEDIIYKTYDGEDFFGIPMDNRSMSIDTKSIVFHRTDSIQAFGVMAEGYEKYRMDPFTFVD